MKKQIMAVMIGIISSTAVFGLKNETRKFAVLVAAENGGADKARLKYSRSDTESFQKILIRLSGLEPSDTRILTNPDKKTFIKEMDSLSSLALSLSKKYKKTEFIFYYSGHSDENGLNLNHETISYQYIREYMKSLPFDLKIVILDSCSSGGLTRAKGGIKRPPFIYNPAYDMRGEAYLTSSSVDEISQESDLIKGSFFTYYLVSGLYGAADYNKDYQVTLSEAYQFAYSKTLARTEKTRGGPQHPNFDISMTGTGDVVMTNLRSSPSILGFDDNVSGQLFIRDSRNQLIAELDKSPGNQINIGLDTGNYNIVLLQPGKMFETKLNIGIKEKILLSENNFNLTTSDADEINRFKGLNLPEQSENQNDTTNDRDLKIIMPEIGFLNNLSIQFFPELQTNRPPTAIALFILAGYLPDVTILSAASLISIIGNNMNGLQASGIGNLVGNNQTGIQTAGIFNVNLHSGDGVQMSGVFNFNGMNYSGLQMAGVFNFNKQTFDGLQTAGVFNHAKDLKGVQIAGVFNYAERLDGMQVGLINIASTGNSPMFGLINLYLNEDHYAELWMDETGFVTAGYRNSTRNFHFIYGAGANTDLNSPKISLGMGVHFPVSESFEIGFDYLANALATNFTNNVPFSDMLWHNVHQIRATFDIRLWKHLAVFAGAGLSFGWSAGNNTDFEPEFIQSSMFRGIKIWPGFFVGLRF